MSREQKLEVYPFIPITSKWLFVVLHVQQFFLILFLQVFQFVGSFYFFWELLSVCHLFVVCRGNLFVFL